MGSMRHETYYAGEQLLNLMWRAGLIQRVHHDGGDIVLLELQSGQMLSIHLIESGIPLYEIRKIVLNNDAQGIYTLFMLWAMMMIPNDGKRYRMDDWMQGFEALNGGCVYGYDIIDQEVYLFPVYFRGTDAIRLTEYGVTLRVPQLRCHTVTIDLPGLEGTWRVADFNSTEIPRALPRALPELEADYALLGVMPGDDRDTIKQAYRILARRYHPDANPDPEAHEQMQRLNEAYAKVMAALEG
jgi:hypothetical protein